jgi:DNA-directed RNA polymerase specialized sigma subunit
MEEKGNKRGRKKTKNFYFDTREEEAVVRYLNEEDPIVRNKIYNDYLRLPLNKMVDSIIRKYKLYRKDYHYDDLHADTLSNLIIKCTKFDPSKGNKAYSYYGTICRNYLIGMMIKDTKETNRKLDFDTSMGKIHEKDEYTYEMDIQDYTLTDLLLNIRVEVIKELNSKPKTNRKKITENEIKVGQALIQILDQWEYIFNNMDGGVKFNKMIVLSTIKTYTNLTTKEIASAMRRYKRIYTIVKTSKINRGLL